MKLDKNYGFLIATIILSLSAVTAVFLQSPNANVLAAALAIGAYAALEYASHTSRKEGRPKAFRASMALTTSGYELILLAGLLFLPIIPKFLAVLVLVGVAVTEIFSLKLLDELRSKYRLSIGRKGRVAAIVASFIGYGFNPYFAMYGAIIVLGIAIYDFTGLALQLYRNLYE